MYEVLVTALQTLAGVCDGARADDGMGFNGRDAQFGHSLAQQSLAHQLSDKQQAAAIKMLQTYKNQLKSHGIMLPSIVEYAGAAASTPKPVNKSYPTAEPTKERSGPENGLHVTVSAHHGAYALKFPYNPILVEKVKAMPRRSFDREAKFWVVPHDCDAEINQVLQGYDVTWDEAALAIKNNVNSIRNASKQDSSDLAIPNLTGELMPFQKAGVAFIDKCKGRAIIGDDMGLGKTIQAIGYLALHPELRPAVIVVPASLKPNWRREIDKWLTINNLTHVINGTKSYDVPGSHIFIINYDILAKWTVWLSALNPAVLICDEAHMIKTQSAARTKAVQKLAKASRNVILMTGTPLMNRPVELYPLLVATQPGQWLNFMSYALRYCRAHKKRIGKKEVWDFSGASNLAELNDKLKTTMIRRLKSEVLTDLPPKRRVFVPIEIDMKKYQRFMEDTLEELELAGNRAAQLAIIEKAKQYVVEAKMDDIFEWVDNFLDSGEKLILFCVHKATVSALMDRYEQHAVKITGDSSQEDRDNAVQMFQNDNSVNLFVGNIQAAGVGLTLTAASNVAFVELGWRPGDQTQAEDRAHRYGQTNAVTIWYLLAEGTIEETIYNLLEKKREVVEMVADGKVSDFGFNEGNVTEDLITALTKGKKK